jgi:hypothetical protein
VINKIEEPPGRATPCNCEQNHIRTSLSVRNFEQQLVF